MKIFVSDLHMGDGSRTDDFSFHDEFLAFLDYAEGKAEEFILAGDVFELWQSDLDKVILHNHRVIQRILKLAKKIRVCYCIGNHDYIPFVKLIDAGLNIDMQYADKTCKIWSEHGHQYDVFNRYENPGHVIESPIGRRLAEIIGWAEKYIHPDVDQWLSRHVFKKITPFLKLVADTKNKVTPTEPLYKRLGGNLEEYEQAARKLIDRGNKIIIFGHTHIAKLIRFNGGVYANCGAWCGNVVPTFVKVDRNTIELVSGLDFKTIEAQKI